LPSAPQLQIDRAGYNSPPAASPNQFQPSPRLRNVMARSLLQAPSRRRNLQAGGLLRTPMSRLREFRHTAPTEPAVEVEMTRKWLTMVALVVLWGFVVTPAQGPGLNWVMGRKLDHAKAILEAVVTSDWVGLETHSRELEALTRDPRWTVLQFDEYRRHSDAFVGAVRALHRAAAQRDLETSPRAYIEVTLQCVACHRYLARARLAE
jgi:hypothetical protein